MGCATALKSEETGHQRPAEIPVVLPPLKTHAGCITASQQKANKQADRINRLYSPVFPGKSMIFFPCFPSNTHRFVSKPLCTRASFVSQPCRPNPLINKVLAEPQVPQRHDFTPDETPKPDSQRSATLPGGFIPLCSPCC